MTTTPDYEQCGSKIAARFEPWYHSTRKAVEYAGLGAKRTVRGRPWEKDEVDALKAATLHGVARGVPDAHAKQFGRTPRQVRSKITELRLRGEIADTPINGGRQWHPSSPTKRD
jgi:hypothetical protein